jgi:hypothetical protein
MWLAVIACLALFFSRWFKDSTEVAADRGDTLQQPLPVIRDGEAPLAGRTETVPSHFDGVTVSHVPLAELPLEVQPGTHPTLPTVVHATREKGGGTIYRLDSTGGELVRAPPAASPEKSLAAS